MTKYVAGLLFNDDGSKVALIHKNHGPAAVVGRWNAIGGKRVNNSDLKLPDESADAAMSREFIEEAGVCCKWTRFLILRGGDWEVTFFESFSSDRLAAVKTMESEEVRVFDLRELPLADLNVVPNLRWIIPMAKGHKDDHVWVYEVTEKDTFAA